MEYVTWKGISGKPYKFEVYPKNSSFINSNGNYIFARKVGFDGWEAVYIGQGNLMERTKDKEHLGCAERKGFTHYHVHTNPSKTLRKKEEEDLIKGNIECLEENGGCNKTNHG